MSAPAGDGALAPGGALPPVSAHHYSLSELLPQRLIVGCSVLLSSPNVALS